MICPGIVFCFVFLTNLLGIKYLLSNYKLRFAFILGKFLSIIYKIIAAHPSLPSVSLGTTYYSYNKSLDPFVSSRNLSISIHLFCSLSNCLYLAFLVLHAGINTIHIFFNSPFGFLCFFEDHVCFFQLQKTSGVGSQLCPQRY